MYSSIPLSPLYSRLHLLTSSKQFEQTGDIRETKTSLALKDKVFKIKIRLHICTNSSRSKLTNIFPYKTSTLPESNMMMILNKYEFVYS